MRAKTKSWRFIGLAFVYLLLLGFGMTFLGGCGNNLANVGTVDKWQDPPELTDSQEQTNINRTAAQPDPSVSAGMLPASANLTAGDLDAAIKANKGWQLIDIRESREFAAGHIETAVNIPLGDLENKLSQISKDKDIVLIDLNGTRSETAWQTMVKKGYDQSKVKVLAGGMLQWSGTGSAGKSGDSNAGSSSGNPGSSGDTGSNAAAPKPEVVERVGGC